MESKKKLLALRQENKAGAHEVLRDRVDNVKEVLESKLSRAGPLR